MPSGNNYTDFKKDDIVYYVEPNSQPEENQSPIFKDCREGIVTSFRYPFIMVKFKTGKTYVNKSKNIYPKDLWK